MLFLTVGVLGFVLGYRQGYQAGTGENAICWEKLEAVAGFVSLATAGNPSLFDL